MRALARDVASAAVARVRPRRGNRIVVLHDVADPVRLRERLTWLAENYDVVSLPALFRDTSSAKVPVALTLDDGYRSWYDTAAPVLVDLSIPAVFFICSGFVGLSGPSARAFCVDRLRRRTVLEPLEIAQVRELAANQLFEIGSHTVHHTDLGRPAGQSAVESEIGDDRRRLEDWTGKPVRWFAFPFGQPEHASPAAVAYLRAQGFAGAFTLVPSFVDGADRFAVGRDSLDVRAPSWVWQGRLGGGYDGLYRLKRRLFRGLVE